VTPTWPWRSLALAVLFVALLPGSVGRAADAFAPPPVDAGFDYQIGGDHDLPAGTGIVSRDWFSGQAPADAYGICYVNAFQTQANEAGAHRPDERSSWPRSLVLNRLGDDPRWGGEYLIDLSTAQKRARAAAWVEPMIHTCADMGFEAVEFDNLDSWTRFDGTPVENRVPFGRRHAIAYAALLVDIAHGRGLAAAQKNTVQLSRHASLTRIGFDFAIAEECGRYDECQGYRDVFGDHVIVIEYRRRDFLETCGQHGAALSVVLRDRGVRTPDSPRYRFAAC
jgi:hypothetical protein